jgi:hypothetical protein
MKLKRRFGSKPLVCLAAAGIAALIAESPARAELIYAMTTSQQGSIMGEKLVRFDSGSPSNITNIGNFTYSGLDFQYFIRSMDFRPSTGQLYALGVAGDQFTAKLFTVNLSTGALTGVGAPFVLDGNTSPVNTSLIEMDFNPVDDDIRVMTGGATSNNFRVDPNIGGLKAKDSSIAFAPGDINAGADPVIVAGAYANSRPGATSTTLYALDFSYHDLIAIGGIDGNPSANSGLGYTVADHIQRQGSLMSVIGMDISGSTNTLYVSHDDGLGGGAMGLYSRDLTTSIEMKIGDYPTGIFISDFAVFPTLASVPEPSFLWAFGILPLLASGGRFRKRNPARERSGE